MTEDRSHGSRGSHGWKAHADGQAAAWARLSHLERLRWLQSAKHFAKLATDAALDGSRTPRCSRPARGRGPDAQTVAGLTHSTR